ncbi:hypothetical protein CPB86DRAFT_778802, partial [Serendipita vermifera]
MSQDTRATPAQFEGSHPSLSFASRSHTFADSVQRRQFMRGFHIIQRTRAILHTVFSRQRKNVPTTESTSENSQGIVGGLPDAIDTRREAYSAPNADALHFESARVSHPEITTSTNDHFAGPVPAPTPLSRPRRRLHRRTAPRSANNPREANQTENNITDRPEGGRQPSGSSRWKAFMRNMAYAVITSGRLF